MMNNSGSPLRILFRVVSLVAILYFFIVSIGLLGSSFKLFGADFARMLVEAASNPVVGLFVGILATTLVQSSSTTTSLIVGFVGSGVLNLEIAIPMVMGANIGTTVTNTIVSIGHISRAGDFRRAFAAATVHDSFNLLAVIVFLPLQMATGFLTTASSYLAGVFGALGGFKFSSPLKAATKPAIESVLGFLGDFEWISADILPWAGCAVAIIIMLLSLRQLVVLLKSVILGRVEQFFQRFLFGNPAYAFGLGIILTTFVQSSSITTSIIIPLVGAGILTVRQIFPYTLGANIGTTSTALLAALVTGNPVAVAVAISHLLFNICGIAVFWPLSRIPLMMSEALAKLTLKSRLLPLAYIAIVFYVIPGALIFLMR